jgi:guanylate kinase
MENARVEIAKWDRYDYVIINRDLDHSLAAARAVLTAERLRRGRVTGLAEFVDGLLAEAKALVEEPAAASRQSSGGER